MKHIGIVMSAGVGSRMGADIPKQYMDLCGKPVIYYSLRAMQESFIDEIILVTGVQDIEFCKKEIVEKYSFSKVTAVVAGGRERSDSVYEGIKAVSDINNSYVYIHDGARPMLSKDILLRTKAAVEKYGATVVAVNSKDTVKIVGEAGEVISTPDRKNVWNVQTPQAFRTEDLLEAFENMKKVPDAKVTDDGMVMEQYGRLKVYVTEGDYFNLKITTPEDLFTAEKIIKKLEKIS